MLETIVKPGDQAVTLMGGLAIASALQKEAYKDVAPTRNPNIASPQHLDLNEPIKGFPGQIEDPSRIASNKAPEATGIKSDHAHSPEPSDGRQGSSSAPTEGHPTSAPNGVGPIYLRR